MEKFQLFCHNFALRSIFCDDQTSKVIKHAQNYVNRAKEVSMKVERRSKFIYLGRKCTLPGQEDKVGRDHVEWQPLFQSRPDLFLGGLTFRDNVGDQKLVLPFRSLH